jgi:DNA-binding transcriptional MerR regulator
MRLTELSPPSQQPLPCAKTGSGRDVTHADAATFTIGQLAQEFGLTLRALRFYESLGLLTPQRNGAVRLYAQADRDRIALIVQGKGLGFTLREIRQLLEVPAAENDQPALHLTRAQCVEQINLLERQKHMIENAILELRQAYSSMYSGELARETSEAGHTAK